MGKKRPVVGARVRMTLGKWGSGRKHASAGKVRVSYRCLPCALIMAAAFGCARSNSAEPPVCRTISFTAETPYVGDEQYVCFELQPSVVPGQFLQSISVTPPTAGPIVRHHVSIFAQSGAVSSVSCQQIHETAVGIYRWVPGGEWLALPKDAAIELPDQIDRIVVQAHVVRVTDGPAEATSIEWCSPANPPKHAAHWLPLLAPVPAIRPQHEEISTSIHSVSEPLYVFSSWPHMHRVGAEFHAAIIGNNGARRPMVDIVPWDVDAQSIYPVADHVLPGESIETTCIWRNPTTEYVFPGPGIENEMCNQVLVVWPADAGTDAP